MADKIIRLDLVGLPTDPALTNVQPGKPARRLHVHQMLGAQDRPITAGRRILAYYSWDGEYDHEFGHLYMVDGDEAGVNTSGSHRGPYPVPSAPRTLLEIEGMPVTPGCVLAVHVTHMTSGACLTANQLVDPGVALPYVTNGSSGQISAAVTWDDQTATETVTSLIDLAAGATAPYSIADADGAGWHAMREAAELNMPGGLPYLASEVVQWSKAGVTVDITLQAIGCARVVDVVIYEVPYRFGHETGTAAGPAHCYAETGAPHGMFPEEYPVEGAPSGDARYGATYALQVAAAQETQLGPSLWCYSSRRERFASRDWSTSADPSPETITGTTETILGGGTVAASAPRIDVGTLAYGRRFAQSDPVDVMAENGACRVAFSAYMSVSAGTGTMRIESADYSSAELSTTSTSYEWQTATTDLACGAHPLDGFTATISGENSGANDTRVRYAWCAYWPE